MNRLLFGDNLNWLRNKDIFPDASVDLVYLDPPFNSNADCQLTAPFSTVCPDALQFRSSV